MIEIRNKWMSASEARQSIESGDFFRMINGNSLFITSEAKPSAAGKVRFNYLVKETGENGTAYLEGLTRKVKQVVNVGDKTGAIIPAKVENSQQNGEHKVINVSMSVSKQQRRFLKAYKLCKQASEVYGLSDVFSGILEKLQELDGYIIKCETAKAQQAIEAAKVKAEEEAIAKKQAELLQKAVSELQNMVENFVQCGMSYKQAEELVKNNPNYTDEQKAAAFGK